MSEEPANGIGFSTKEMLIRIDAKVDFIGGKQSTYDVELALLKARQEVLERAGDAQEKRYEELRAGVDRVGRKIAMAAGGLSALIVAANWVVPATIRHFLGGP